MESKSRRLTLLCKQGIHLRPAAEIARIAQSFEADVVLATTNGRADARSIFEILQLVVGFGDLLELHASGRDAVVALDGIVRVLESLADPSVAPW